MVKRRILKTSVVVVSVMIFAFLLGFAISESIAQEKSAANPAATDKSQPAPAVEKSNVMNNKIKNGNMAPAFDLLDQNGKNVSLKSFAGKKVLVFFYPKANTPGCTVQACSVRDSIADLTKLGVSVVGISPDLTDAQKKFTDKNKLTFPLLSDIDHKVAESYGVWREKIVKGKATTGIIRSSFLIGEDGKIVKTWFKVKAEKTAKLAIEFLSKSKVTNVQKAKP